MPPKLLIAASGTGGHLFPAIATAEELSDYQLEWLGVPDRLETQLVPDRYPMHAINVEGFQQRLGLGTLSILSKLASSVWQVRQILGQGQFHGVFTTGGYIAAPAILAARSLGLPAILHESNALPGKVTRLLSPLCNKVALGFEATSTYLPRAKTVWVGTPVRPQFLVPPTNLPPLTLPIPADAPLIVVVGGSQGAVAVNNLVRQCAAAWFAAGAWIVHLTGERDPNAKQLEHPQYFALPFYDNMAALFHRATLAISRAGAGTLTELAVTRLPAILIPYPFAAEDHQTVNAQIFATTGAAKLFQQANLTVTQLETEVLGLLRSPHLSQMADAMANLALVNSANLLAQLIRNEINIGSIAKRKE